MPKLRDIVLDCRWSPSEGRQFRHETRSVPALLSALIGSPPCAAKKVVVRCDPTWQGPPFRMLGGGVAEQVVGCDPIEFMNQGTIAEKRRWTMAALRTGLKPAFEQLHLPLALLVDAAREGEARGLLHRYSWPKAPVTRRGLRAWVMVDHDVQEAKLELVVQRSDGAEVARSPAITTLPTEFAFVPKLGAVVWLSDTQVELQDRQARRVTAVDVPR